jgi:hypothetical protein
MGARAVAGAAIVVGLLAGCDGGTSPAGHSASPTDRPSSPSHRAADPAGLVGAWYVAAPGETAGTMLTIGDRVDGEVLLFRACGVMDAQWQANRHAMLVMRSDGGDQTCFLPADRHPHPEPAWMLRITTWREAGSGELLLDTSGRTVAKLTPGAHPKVGSNRLSDYGLPPLVTARMRASWSDPAPLPAGVEPVTSRDLRGRWVPVTRRPARAYVQFDPDASYHGSDGCNGAGGQYLLGPGGLVLTTSGPSTAIGCDNSPLPAWVSESARLGLRDRRLVFVDGRGHVLGEAVRA